MRRRRLRRRISRVSGERDVNVYIGPDAQDEYLARVAGDPWRDLPGIEWDHLTPRESLDSSVERFLSRRPQGYLVIEGAAGVGKTTFLAGLAREHGWPAYFVRQGPAGADATDRALESIAVQLARRYGLARRDLLAASFEPKPQRWFRLLTLAVEARGAEPVVIVIDGLDEVGEDTARNVLELPEVVPRHAYVVASQRQRSVRLRARDKEVTTLDALGAANLEELAQYVGSRLERNAMSAPDARRVAELLARKAAGVWIYAYHVLKDLESGRRAWTDLETLPEGLWQYYASSWAPFRTELRDWKDVYLPLLSTLGAIRAPLRVDELCELAGVADADRVTRLLEDAWRPFVIKDDESAAWALLHDSLASFLTGAVDDSSLSEHDRVLVREFASASRSAHGGIADRVLSSWGTLERGLPDLLARLADNAPNSTDDYGLRHLVTHLVAAGSDHVHSLLTATVTVQAAGMPSLPPRDLWFTLQERAGDLDGYAEDLRRAWKVLDADGPAPLDEHLRYALRVSTAASAAGSVPPALLRELVHHGIWTLRQALAYVRRARSAESRAFGLLELTDFMDERDAAQALRDVEYLSEGVIDPKDRFNLALGVAFRDEAQQRERRMREALAIAGAADEEFDIRSGLMLSWALTAAERRDAEARAIRRLESSDSLDASLLLAVVRGLPSTELDRLARRVERYSNAYDRARGLAILATVEQDDRRARLVTELRRAIETLSAEERPAWHRADALIDMALLVDGEEASTLLDEAEELLERPPAARQRPEGAPWEREIGRMLEAMSGDDRVYIARSYGRLARSRRDRAADYGGKALKVASGVKNAGWRLDALYGVARNDAFPPDIRHSAARRAFAAGARLGTRGEFVGAAGQIAGQLPADDLSRAAAAVQTIGDASVRHHAAAKILICASTSTANRTESVRLLRSACDRVALVRDGHMQTELIRQAAPMADRPGLRTLANATESIESEEWRAVALAELSRWLPRSLRDRATRIAAEIGDDQYGVPLRAGLAARLARDSTRRQKASVVLEESARMGEALAERVPRIRQAGPFDPWPEPGEIFVGAVKALAAIATDETRDALVECVRRFHAAGYRAKALAALAAALPSGPAWELLSETATASTEDGFLAVLEALGETLDGAGLESVIDVALALEDDAAGLAVAIMADRLSLVAAERAALELASRASASANAAHGVGSVLRTLREHGQEAAARRVVAELDKQLGRARTDAARLAKAYAAPWLDRAAKRRTTFWLARRARRAADAANPAAFRWLLPDAVRDRLEERLIPGDDERADPKRACALIVDELPNLRRPDARRRLVRWAASALLAAAPEPRYSALMAIMDSGASDDLPYSARSEAWQAAVEIELPPNRLYALEQLASAPAADEEAHVVQALRVLAEAERPEFLMSLAPIAPLLARRARSPALLVEIVDSAGELWP